MQTFGSGSAPPAENQLKSIFWPSIRHETDVVHIGQQGFWICFAIATTDFAVGAFQGHFGPGLFEFLFYFFGALGVQARSRFAAIAIFVSHLVTTMVLQSIMSQGFRTIRILGLALLLANIRNTWLSATWHGNGPETAPVPRSQPAFDKLSARLAFYLWPKTNWAFYVVAVVEIGMLIVAFFIPRNLTA